MITRKSENDLKKWYSSPKRKPLVIRGARQVGKSTLVREFAKKNNLTLLEVNLEKQFHFEKIFKKLDINEIVNELSIILKVKPSTDRKHLLFLDEIQATPSALPALRYFYEEMPELPVIAAGSLLEFTLKKHNYSMPVGRIEYLFLAPFTFREFLTAGNEEYLIHYLANFRTSDTFSQTAHEYLQTLLRQYLIVGGMPEAVALFADTKDVITAQKVHHSILNTYEDDFSKYASGTVLEKINHLFRYIPSAVGEKFKYSNVNRNWLARDIRTALHLLEKAGLVFLVHATNGNTIPLSAHSNNKTFKTFFLDVGLMNTASGIRGLSTEEIVSQRFINEGKMAEQFIAQHLFYGKEAYIKPELHYWLRDNKKGNAEIDFLTQFGTRIIPVEVKAGKSGSLKSLHQFITVYKKEHAVRFDLNTPSKQHLKHRVTTTKGSEEVSYDLLNLPLYMVDELGRQVESEM